MASDNALPAIDFAARRTRTQDRLREHNLAALIAIAGYAGRDGHVAYLTNHRILSPSGMGRAGSGGAAYVLPAAAPGMLIAPAGYDPDSVDGVAEIKTGGELIPGLIAVLEAAGLANQRLGIAGMDDLSAESYETLRDGLPEATFSDAADISDGQRMTKDSAELARLRFAAGCADAALTAGVARMQPGAPGYQIELAAREAAYGIGAERVAHVEIAAGATANALSRAMSPAQVLQEGDLAYLQVSGWAGGYAFGNTRVTVAGRATDEQRDYLAHLAEATDWMIETLKPGAEMRYVFTESRGRRIEATGHGIGLEISERPWIREGEPFTLRPGMVLSIGSNVISPSLGCLAIKDMVVITEDGAEVLNRCPRILR